jgi:hypothetical protein
MKRRYGEVSLALVLGVVVAVMAAVIAVRVSDAITFDVTLTASVADSTAGAASDKTTEFGIGAGSAQYLATATFTPPEFGQTAGSDIPLGAIVGSLDANATLGLINGPCNSALPVTFDMMNATTDTSATVNFDEQFQDADANTLPDGVDKFPDFITRMLPGITPIFRQFGQASVAGSAVSLNFVVYEPGATIPGLGTIDPSWGWASVSILNNNGDPGAISAPSAITEFCTPLSTIVTTFGVSKDNPATSADESGVTIQTNPEVGGTYTFRARSISLYDADDDNIDNSLDTCPYVANTGCDISVAGDCDEDNDGLMDACDPNPTETKVDEDDDAYTNRGDNCPTVANGADPDNQLDRDTDGIGDACDQNPDTPDAGSASPVDVTNEATVEITGGAAPPTETETPAATETAPAATGTATATATTTTTVVATPTATPAPTPVPAEVGGGGLLGGDEGFPTWGFVLIGVAAALLLGGLSTAVTVRRRSR